MASTGKGVDLFVDNTKKLLVSPDNCRKLVQAVLRHGKSWSTPVTPPSEGPHTCAKDGLHVVHLPRGGLGLYQKVGPHPPVVHIPAYSGGAGTGASLGEDVVEALEKLGVDRKSVV